MPHDDGILIAIEGIDGAGKTTQVARLGDFLRRAGLGALCSKEPTDGPWGQRIRASAMSNRLTLAEELQAFTNDREEHLREKIRPALARRDTVILDRYFYSTAAYQGARGAAAESILAGQKAIFPTPDATFILDVPAELGLRRVSGSRGDVPNSFETLATLDAARDIFRSLADRPEVMIVNGTLPADMVHARIVNALVEGPFKRLHCAKVYGCDEPLTCIDRMLGDCRWVKIKQASAAL